MFAKAVLLVLMILFIFCPVHGLTQSEVAPKEDTKNIKLEYLYINKKIIPAGEKKLVFYRELLPGGRVSIAGKVADSVKGPVVEISVDGKRTWGDAMVQNNAFWYSFEAQGTVAETANTEVIVVSNSGQAKKVTYQESVNNLESGGTTSVEVRSVTLNFVAAGNSQGLKFSTYTRTIENNPPPTQNGDIMMVCPGLRLNVGVFAQYLGIKSIESITEVPTTGYSIGGMISPITQGQSYAIKLADGKYAAIEIVNVTAGVCPVPRTATIRYKYQPSGSNTF